MIAPNRKVELSTLTEGRTPIFARVSSNEATLTEVTARALKELVLASEIHFTAGDFEIVIPLLSLNAVKAGDDSIPVRAIVRSGNNREEEIDLVLPGPISAHRDQTFPEPATDEPLSQPAVQTRPAQIIESAQGQKWLALVVWAERTSALTDWEYSFASTITEQLLKGGRISVRQAPIAEKILTKAAKRGWSHQHFRAGG